MNTEFRAATQNILEEFNNVWSYDSRDLAKPSVEQALRDLILARRPHVRDRLLAEFFGEGPLGPLLKDKEVTEILVNGSDEIWFEKWGQLQPLPDQFLSSITFKSFVERLCVESQVRVDWAQPFADGRWREFRLHLVHAPITACGIHLSLRRCAAQPWTLEALQTRGWASAERVQVLRQLIHRRANILFIGPTGSGKTSVLGASLMELPSHERVVILEDTEELPRPNSASTKMLTRSSCPQWGEVDLTDLLRQSLRMRPSRLVVGEVRGGEAKDLLMALATGHSGSLSSLHAVDARQALLRLEMLVQLGAPQWQLQAVRQLLLLSVSHLVVCGLRDGQRFLDGIFRVAALESVGFLLEPV